MKELLDSNDIYKEENLPDYNQNYLRATIMKQFQLLIGLLLGLFTCSSQILDSQPLYDLQIDDEEYNNKWNEASIKILFIYFTMI